MEVLDYGKETSILVNLEPGELYWKMSFQGQIKHVTFFSIYCEDWQKTIVC